MLPNLPAINPLDTTAMHFFDAGDVQSDDGRSHPVTAMTPVSLIPGTPSLLPVSLPSPSGLIPKHLGARLAVGVLAIGILLIVAFRLAK